MPSMPSQFHNKEPGQHPHQQMSPTAQPPPRRLTSAATPLPHSMVDTLRCAPPLAAVSHWFTLAAKRSEHRLSCGMARGTGTIYAWMHCPSTEPALSAIRYPEWLQQKFQPAC